jgi:hypothetical protein
MSRRLVAWVVIRGPLGRAFTDPSVCDERAPDTDSLLDAVLIPRRLKREQELDAVKHAGREAWRAHHGQEAAS